MIEICEEAKRRACALAEKLRTKSCAKWEVCDVGDERYNAITALAQVIEDFSDAARDAIEIYHIPKCSALNDFVIPKPDILAEALQEASHGCAWAPESIAQLRRAVDRRGYVLEIIKRAPDGAMQQGIRE